MALERQRLGGREESQWEWRLRLSCPVCGRTHSILTPRSINRRWSPPNQHHPSPPCFNSSTHPAPRRDADADADADVHPFSLGVHVCFCSNTMRGQPLDSEPLLEGAGQERQETRGKAEAADMRSPDPQGIRLLIHWCYLWKIRHHLSHHHRRRYWPNHAYTISHPDKLANAISSHLDKVRATHSPQKSSGWAKIRASEVPKKTICLAHETQSQ